MDKSRRCRRPWPLAVIVILGLGCSDQDSACLARIGARLGTKVDMLTGGAESRLANGWKAVRANLDDMALDTRVSARLLWDKEMEGSHVQVQASDGEIILQGTVRDLVQKKRATLLSETTVGVDKVTDNLEVQAAETEK
jgi:hypothetical protein